MKDKRVIQSLVLLTSLLLYTACAPLPATEVSPTRMSPQPTSAPSPTPTAAPTRALSSPTPVFEGLIDSLAVSPKGTLYAAGYGSSSDASRRLAQWDGTKWTALETGFEPDGGPLVTDSAGHLYTSGLTAFEHGMATVMERWDGAGWQEITGNFSTVVDALQAGRISSNIPVIALAVDGEDRLYAAGSFQYPSADNTMEWPMGYVARWDQGAWTVLGQGFDRVQIYSMAVSPAGQVYASGEQSRIPAGESGPAGFVAAWDGKTWRQIGTSELDACSNLRNLTLDETGGLYARCTRNGPGEPIFHWDGTDWTTVTDQLQGEAPALYDMAVDGKGHLYIGGSFDSVSGTPARNIAFWDGSAWHALGDGIQGQVYAIAFDTAGDLYASGMFTESGSLYTGRAARWDGETWHMLAP